MRVTRRAQALLLLVLAALLLAACAPQLDSLPGAQTAPNTPVSSETPTVPSPTPTDEKAVAGGEGETISREASIEELQLNIMESLPVQISATIRGQFPDGCTRFGYVEQTVERDKIRIAAMTTRPAEAFCTQALVPFEETIPVDISALEPGTYIVDVNGITSTLTLEESMLGTPPDSGE